jgi:hypothetical protein
VPHNSYAVWNMGDIPLPVFHCELTRSLWFRHHQKDNSSSKGSRPSIKVTANPY